MLFPDLHMAPCRELQRLSVVMRTITQGFERVLIDLIRWNDPEDQPAAVTLRHQQPVSQTKDPGSQKSLAAASGDLEAKGRQIRFGAGSHLIIAAEIEVVPSVLSGMLEVPLPALFR